MFIFFFNDTATTEIYTLSLHDALPIYPLFFKIFKRLPSFEAISTIKSFFFISLIFDMFNRSEEHTLNSSHKPISYAVFCLKKKNSYKHHYIHANTSQQLNRAPMYN